MVIKGGWKREVFENVVRRVKREEHLLDAMQRCKKEAASGRKGRGNAVFGLREGEGRQDSANLIFCQVGLSAT